MPWLCRILTESGPCAVSDMISVADSVISSVVQMSICGCTRRMFPFLIVPRAAQCIRFCGQFSPLTIEL